MDATDAVVIGSGPNGLVAANLLADAGWEVTILEAQDDVGGAVRSDQSVHPGFVHDTFSSFYPLAAVSPTIRRLELEKFGLAWANAPAVVGTPFEDGSWALLHANRDDTAAGLDDAAPGDGEAWLDMCRSWDAIGDQVVGALLTPFPPLRHALGALARLPRAGGAAFVRSLLAPARTVAEQHFAGRAPRILLAGNAAHADIPLDGNGSAFMGWLLVMMGQHAGFPVPVGGAGALTRAMARRLESKGGKVLLRTRANRVEVAEGRAVAVVADGGERFPVRRAVVADVSAPALYGGLVSWDDLPPRTRRNMRRFEWDPGTVKVDWALSGPVPWASAPSAAPGTVHIAESLDEIAEAGVQIAAGSVPAKPFLLVGQMTAADPVRAPAGSESLWAYTHVPRRPTFDAGDGSVGGSWDQDDVERMADRIQARIEHYAPGFGSRVLARRVLGPHEMQALDENLYEGALNGGTAALQQQLVLRPIPGLGRAETPVKGLYLGSASAHPGGGVHGACGSNAARAALLHERLEALTGTARAGAGLLTGSRGPREPQRRESGGAW
jgi:phytoene dehydrogenase-like protein